MPARALGPNLCIATLAIACARAGGDEDDGDATETEGYEPRPMPDFVEPASDEMLVGVLRHDDLSLPVVSVLPGLTTLEIDGVDVGALLEPGGVGLLGADRIDLRLEGAMVPSVHEIRLRTPDADETRYSRTIRVILAQEPAPVLALELGAEPEATATALSATPHGDDSLLAVIDHAALPDPIVRVARVVDGTWALAGARTIAAPGLRRATGERASALSVFLVRDAVERLRVAWRVGFPGERIDVMEVDWQGDDPGVPVAALTLTSELTGPVEWAAFGRPLVAGDRVIAELVRHADVEAPVPGELALATAVLGGGQPGLPQLLALGDVADFDALAPAVDLLASEGGDLGVASLRRSRRRPVLLELGLSDAAASLRASAAVDDPLGLDLLSSPVASIAGAFGSRTVATFDATRLRVLRFDDSGMGGLVDVSPEDGVVPSASEHTGEIASTVIGGAPVFVLPFGVDLPLYAVVVSETTTSVQELSAIGCDMVATAASAAGNDAGATAIACLREGAVLLGRLRVGP